MHSRQASESTEEDILQALSEENARLRQRVTMLEGALDAYRSQTSALFRSASWRVTAPLRVAADRSRRIRQRIRAIRSDDLRPFLSDPSIASGLFTPAIDPADAEHHPLLVGALPTQVANSRPRPMRPAPTRRRPEWPRVLVLVHVYYPEIWPSIADRLSRMPERFDLVVSLTRHRAEGLERDILCSFPQAKIAVVDNIGRDIWPFLCMIEQGLAHGYDAVLKLHTKRSPHRLDGDLWRERLLDALLPSPEGIARILDVLRRDREVGLVVPDGNVLGAEFWGSNRELVETIAARVPLAFDPESLLFPAGSMFWSRPFLLERLGDPGIAAEDFEPETDAIDSTLGHAMERYVGVVARASGLAIIETGDVASRLSRLSRTKPGPRPKILAFYLPQYHRICENDEWWGEGFTDWVNLDQSIPLFPGHTITQPADEVGRYDLTDPQVMRRQAALADQYGVDAFVMHYYWFGGKKLLERPLETVLKNPDMDFPFALCWANEPWTRRWDGLDQEILIAQTYPDGWADDFFHDLLPAMQDPRYFRIDGRPLLVIYRANQIPDFSGAVARWRQLAAGAGLHDGLSIHAVLPDSGFSEMADVGTAVDQFLTFPPASGLALDELTVPGHGPGAVGIYAYAACPTEQTAHSFLGKPIASTVFPGWDNTPRRLTAGYVFHGANPASFRRWVSEADVSSGLLFVNAWNEWAEGAALEPSHNFGRGNLAALADALG